MTNRIAAGLIAGALVLGLLVGAAGTILAGGLSAGAAGWPAGYPSMMGAGGRGYGPMMGGGGGGGMMGGGYGGEYGPMMDPDDMGPYASFMPDWMWQHMGWSSDEPAPSESPR